MEFSNQILHGDCNELLRSVSGESVDLVVTDPPYGVHYRDRNGRSVANDDHLGHVLGAFSQIYRVMRPDTVCISFYGWNKVDAFFAAWRRAGLYPVGHIVWVGPPSSMLNRGRTPIGANFSLRTGRFEHLDKDAR
jgi:DNA modification methylase